MNKLMKAKQVIAENYKFGDCGLFNTRNIVGDHMTTIYEDDSLTIDICYGWSYFEVFGLSETEFTRLHEFYKQLQRLNRRYE